MNKKKSYYLVLVSLMMFCITQPIFGGFRIQLNNESGIAYDNVEIIITAEGYSALYGRISLGAIGGVEQKTRECTYKYGEFPLIGTGMPSSLEECNLNMMVVAGPKSTSRKILVSEFKNIVESPQIIITEEEPRKYPLQSSMEGIKPPNIIEIIIRGISDDNPDGMIEAKADGRKLSRYIGG